MYELSREILNEILETAGLEEVRPDDRLDEAPDLVRIRDNYSGRGYGRDGFGLVTNSASALSRFLVAAGKVDATREANDLPGINSMELAEATCSDSMGLGMIFYWPGWTLED